MVEAWISPTANLVDHFDKGRLTMHEFIQRETGQLNMHLEAKIFPRAALSLTWI
jgi:hypothetical protein